jgi:hypothetical protein
MDRRLFLLALATIPASSFGQVAPEKRIAILTDIVTAIGAAGKAISDLTAGIKDLVIAGNEGYSYVAAEREKTRLNDIVRRTTNLIATQNVMVVRSLDEYLTLPQPTERDWYVVARNVDSTLTSVGELLADVQNENGSFVNQDASLTLKKTLASRSVVLGKLSTMIPPFSKEEQAILRKASAEYKVLISNAELAVKELNAYIRAKK